MFCYKGWNYPFQNYFSLFLMFGVENHLATVHFPLPNITTKTLDIFSCFAGLGLMSKNAFDV